MKLQLTGRCENLKQCRCDVFVDVQCNPYQIYPKTAKVDNDSPHQISSTISRSSWREMLITYSNDYEIVINTECATLFIDAVRHGNYNSITAIV